MFRCRWELPHSQLPASRISQHLDRSPTFLRGRLNHQLLQFRYRIFRRYRDLYLRLRRHSWRDGQHNALERNDHEPFLDHCIEHESVLDELNRRNRHARQRHDHQPFLHHRIEYKSFQHERKHRRPLRGHPQSHRPRDLCERVRLPSEFHRRGEFHHDRHQRVHRCEQLHRPRILHASLHDQIFGLRPSLCRGLCDDDGAGRDDRHFHAPRFSECRGHQLHLHLLRRFNFYVSQRYRHICNVYFCTRHRPRGRLFRDERDLPCLQRAASRISQHLDRSPAFLRGRLNHQLLQFRYRILRRDGDLYLRLRRQSFSCRHPRRDGRYHTRECDNDKSFQYDRIVNEIVLDQWKHRRPLRGHARAHRPRDICERVRLPSEFHRRGEFHHHRHQCVHWCLHLHRPRILHASLDDQIFGLQQSLLRRHRDLDLRLRRIPHAPIGLPVASVLDRRRRPFHRGRRREHAELDSKRHWLLPP